MFLEAPPGFEPGIRVLQTRALPLGYIAIKFYEIYYKNQVGFCVWWLHNP